VGETEVSQRRRVVVGLVKFYFVTLKGVTVDSFFKAASLAEETFKDRQFTYKLTVGRNGVTVVAVENQ
jgi:hypothetical protein